MNIRMDPGSEKGIVIIIALIPIYLCFFIVDYRFGDCASFSLLAISSTLWFVVALWWGRKIWKERMDEFPVLGVALFVMFILCLLAIGYKAISECRLC